MKHITWKCRVDHDSGTGQIDIHMALGWKYTQRKSRCRYDLCLDMSFGYLKSPYLLPIMAEGILLSRALVNDNGSTIETSSTQWLQDQIFPATRTIFRERLWQSSLWVDESGRNTLWEHGRSALTAFVEWSDPGTRTNPEQSKQSVAPVERWS